MKSYEFPYSCDEWYGSIDYEVSDEEVELIKSAYRDAFAFLEEVDDFDDLRERILTVIKEENSLDDADELDIRIYFPEEITDEVDSEDDE